MAQFGIRISRDELRRRWDAVRAAWPTLVVPAIMSVLILVTGQGLEVLYAITGDGFVLLRTGCVFLVCGILLHASVILAVNVQYPYSRFAIPSIAPVPLAAFWASIGVPAVFGGFYLYQSWTDLTAHPAAAIGRMMGDPTVLGWSPVAGLIACLVPILLLGGWHVLVTRRLLRVVQTHATRFLVPTGFLTRMQGLSLVLVGALALVIWFYPRLATWFGPVAVFTVAMTVWASFGTAFVSLVSRRDWLLLSPMTLAAVWFVLVAAATSIVGEEYYSVIPHVPCTLCQPERDATSYARKWLDERKSSGPVTAIVVIADGGGIRAALDTASTLAELDRQTEGRFYGHVYAMSGASGGAIGLASYVSAHAAGRGPQSIVQDVRDYLGADHFSPLLAGLLLRDVPEALFPLGVLRELPALRPYVRNRAETFEESLIEGGTIGGEMGRGLVDVVRRSTGPAHKTPPVLLLNTTLANTGMTETASNVSFSGEDNADEPCNLLDRLAGRSTIPIAAAAHLSARFPVSNPPAEFTAHDGGRGRCAIADGGARLEYVDGGYVDNTGATSVMAAVKALDAALRRENAGRKTPVTVRLVVIHIYASNGDTQNRASVRTKGVAARYVQDLSVPAATLSSIRDVQGYVPLQILCKQMVAMNGSASNPECGRISADQAASSDDRSGSPVRRMWQPSRGLYWMNAKLFVSDDAGDPNYVPLGWLLGPSRSHVEREACDDVKLIVAGFDRNSILGARPQPTDMSHDACPDVSVSQHG